MEENVPRFVEFDEENRKLEEKIRAKEKRVEDLKSLMERTKENLVKTTKEIEAYKGKQNALLVRFLKGSGIQINSDSLRRMVNAAEMAEEKPSQDENDSTEESPSSENSPIEEQLQNDMDEEGNDNHDRNLRLFGYQSEG